MANRISQAKIKLTKREVTMTPHISAQKGEIAQKVLMPGDPLRAKVIADQFLTDVKQVSNIRNMLMFTGLYKGEPVSVCGSGMGQPSIGIYSYELFSMYDVETIIRVGSAGAYKKELKLYDIILADSAYTDSTAFSELVLGEAKHLAYPSKTLNELIQQKAAELEIPLNCGRVHSSDVFYSRRAFETTIAVTEAICVEMESAALFTNAKVTGKKAACLLTISDNLITKEETSADQRQHSFTKMMELALSV